MTEVKHAGGIVSSSKVPALHLIPTEALLCLADRFEVGTERKGDGAWNATTKNQECLDDNAFLIERCSHIIRHALLLRDQLAHGYNGEEDSPYENAGAIIFGGALMACATVRHRKGPQVESDDSVYACVDKGLGDFTATVSVLLDPGGKTWVVLEEVIESPDDWVTQDRAGYRYDSDEYRYVFWDRTEGGWGRCRGLEGHVHGYIDSAGGRLEVRCRRKDLPVLEGDPPSVESPDDWVVQDQVLARGFDRGAWVDIGEEYPPYDFSSRHWWTVLNSGALGRAPGFIDTVGRTLHLICRRKDLPSGVGELPTPAVEEEWVDLNQYPDHVLRKGVDWCKGPDLDQWGAVYSLGGDKVARWAASEKGVYRSFDWEFRCLKKDFHPPLAPFTLEVGKSYVCQNGCTHGPMARSASRGVMYARSICDVTWNLNGKARRVDTGMTEETERGFDIVQLVRE